MTPEQSARLDALLHPGRTPGSTPFDGACILVQLEPRGWYVCVPAVATASEYHAIAGPMGRADALKVCRELNEFEPAAYSDLTRRATERPDPEKRHI